MRLIRLSSTFSSRRSINYDIFRSLTWVIPGYARLNSSIISHDITRVLKMFIRSKSSVACANDFTQTPDEQQ